MGKRYATISMNLTVHKEINTRAEACLKAYIENIKPIVQNFFQEQKEVARAISPVAHEMVRVFEQFTGGKRLRGALTELSYNMFCGSPTPDIYKASFIIEIIHGFALMHDDIMDEDALRRGNPTVHVQYERIFDQRHSPGKRNKKLYGTSMAINVGDLGSYYSNLLIERTGFPAERKIAFLKRLSQILIQTIYGQGLDVTFELDPIPNEESVILIHTHKTAHYTIPGPLHYGAILAGISESDPRYKAIEAFGVPVGIAFQLRDDELGMFSNSKTLGKSTTSDLRQGKNTVLFAKAFERGTHAQVEYLKSVRGNPSVTEDDVQKVKTLLIETGALEYSKQVSAHLVEQGKQHIPDITKDPKYQDLLSLIADYVITRES